MTKPIRAAAATYSALASVLTIGALLGSVGAPGAFRQYVHQTPQLAAVNTAVSGTITYWDPTINPGNPDLAPSFAHLNAEFMKMYPNVKVMNDTPSTDPTTFMTDLKTAFVSKSGPDVVNMFPPATDYAQYLTPLNNLLTPGLASQISGISQQSYTVTGKILAVPGGLNNLPLVYNKKLLAKAGITAPPSTLQQFIADCRMLLKANITPIIGGFSDTYLNNWLTNYFSQDEITIADAKAEKNNPQLLTGAPVQAVANDYLPLVRDGFFEKGYLSQGLFQGLADWDKGQGAFEWGSLNQFGDYSKDLGANNWGVIPALSVNGHIYWYGLTSGICWVIPSYSKNKAAAAAYINFLASASSESYFAAHGDFVPSNIDAKVSSSVPAASEITADIAFDPKLPRFDFGNYQPNGWTTAYDTQMEAVVAGSGTVRSALQTALKQTLAPSS